MFRKYWLAIGLLAVFPYCAGKSVGDDLDHFFNNLGMTSNTSAPHAYEGQAAGYYSGGSIYARNSVKNFHLYQIELPSVRGGCGGIDLYLGGMSFINGGELVKAMTSILNSAGSYAFTLALEETVPQVANIMKYLQDQAHKVVDQNLNSCETAEALVDGAWSRIRSSDQKACQDYLTQSGGVQDWAAARSSCTDESQYSQASSEMSKNKKYQDFLLDEVNVAWAALDKDVDLKNDVDMKELLMSLSGSIIVHKLKDGDSKDQPIYAYLPSLVTDKNLLKAILHGSKDAPTTIYRCDETEKCLDPAKSKPITISLENSLSYKVRSHLNSIREKIQKTPDDEALSEDEQAFLQATTLPIYKMLTVQAAFSKDSDILDIESYSELIAIDLLFQYLEENLQLIRQLASIVQYPKDDVLDPFFQGIRNAEEALHREKNAMTQQVISTLQLIQQTQVIEQMLAGQLSSDLSNTLSWAQAMHS